MEPTTPPTGPERAFKAAQAAWLGAKRLVERAVGAERLDGWLDRLRFYELKSRLGRLRKALPDGGTIVYRPMDRHTIEEVYGGCYRMARLEPGYVVLDVGANIGTFTVLAGRKIGPRGRLVSFEPEPENARLLRANVEGNGLSWATVVEAALDRAPGRLKLYRSGDPGMHSLKPRYTRYVEVDVDTLDAAAARLGVGAIDLVKIDVEGAELGVIEGGRAVLGRAKQVVLETHAPDRDAVAAALAGLGFELRHEETTVGGITLYAAKPS